MDFKGKKVTILGLGLLGRGLGDARFFAERGADIIVTDLKTQADLAPSIAALAGFSNITFHLGGHRLEDFENRDLVIKGNGTPLNSLFIAHAVEHGIPVEMDAALFVKLCREKFPGAAGRGAPLVVGITGTRGKSTVTQLIYEMARAGFSAQEHASGAERRAVHLGGNVKDIATLALIDTVGANDIVVLELDSWQLQGFATDAISPNISVWTNFMTDHMNYYRGDMERYFEDKAAIARFQGEGDTFIAPHEIKEQIEKKFGALHGTWSAPDSLPPEWEIGLIGAHNRANAACAVQAARTMSVPDEIIKKVLKEFRGLPGRLESLGEKRGIAVYNDSNATTPDAAIAALRALAEQQRPIILIAGGNDKQLDFQALADELHDLRTNRIVKRVILFEGAASEKLKDLFADNPPPIMATTMREAVSAALGAATAGDIILLSPGATSFGIFKNEYDRGEQFKEAVDEVSE